MLDKYPVYKNRIKEFLRVTVGWESATSNGYLNPLRKINDAAFR